MTHDEIRGTMARLLHQIAPEADLNHIPPDASLRTELDLDSMDFLNFVIALHAELGIDIPEADYAKLATLEGGIDYLAKRTC